MSFEDLKKLIEKELPGAILGVDENAFPKTLLIKPEAIVGLCDFLHKSDQTYFDMLSCLTGIDNGPEANTMEVVYNLYSIPFDLQLMLRVEIDRIEPKIDSVHEIWRTALWHEREAYDLFGIHFEGHPDLRRILLPADWEGHPLRKDYKHQEYYRGIKVEY